MCGRYALFHKQQDLQRLFDVINPEALAEDAHYNIAPTTNIPLVFLDAQGERRAGRARWGLIPSWVKDPGDWRASTFNARADGVADKPTFRRAFRKGRVLVPASGFYEWQKTNGAKQPHFIERSDGEPLAFAGLMDVWRSEDGARRLVSASIVTTDPNAEMAPLHDRMPVILEPDEFASWLDRDTEPDDAAALLDPAPDGLLAHRPVDRRVNSVANDGPELIAEA